jgi:hypothetical protein
MLNLLFSFTIDFKNEIVKSPDKNDISNAFKAENSYPKTLVKGSVRRKRLNTPIIIR